ncbi:RNA-binding protein S1 [Thermus antranikianii]|uniref:S1 RNA-binding domain-containing protein n=1 Tax=Thermus antranikianii TaxID=88190 RepID=A0ABY7RSB4_9DEIN|nr:RNA-binding protein S1 [Thermus antranikianii]WCM40408.1 S1 RNA-binding domain-containing protein [Thermus antranikianii]
MELEAGSVVEGRVVRVTEFGAFVELPGGEQGLVHISQIAHEFVRNVRDFLNEGDIVQVMVKGRDARGRLDLSIKDLTPAPEGAPPPRPRRLPKQSPEFENKLKSFLRGTGGFSGKGGKKGGRKRR